MGVIFSVNETGIFEPINDACQSGAVEFGLLAKIDRGYLVLIIQEPENHSLYRRYVQIRHLVSPESGSQLARLGELEKYAFIRFHDLLPMLLVHYLLACKH